MKSVFFIAVSIWLCSELRAQEFTPRTTNKSLKELNPGDRVPDLKFVVYKGGQKQINHLSDFKGKLIILDYWGINCGPCIGAMPHMLELQKQFNDKIQVILVTVNKKEEVDKLWEQLAKNAAATSGKSVKAYQELPSIVSDSVFYFLFHPNGLPTHVWIDGNMFFRALTHSETTTSGNIAKFLKGEDVDLATTRYVKFDGTKPLTWFDAQNGVDVYPLYYSFFTKHIERQNGSTHLEIAKDSFTGKITGLSIMDKSIVDLYKAAYFKGQFPWKYGFTDADFIMNVKDPSKFYNPDVVDSNYHIWTTDNQYCYALKTKPGEVEDPFSLMKEDLDKFFSLKTALIDTSIKCWVLKRTGILDTVRSASVSKVATAPTSTGLKVQLPGENASGLTNFLQANLKFHNRFQPVVCEIDYKGRFNIELPFAEHTQDNVKISIAELKTWLQKQGLDLIEEFRMRRVLIIQDAK